MDELGLCSECMKVRAHTRSMPPYKCPRCKRIEELEKREAKLIALENAGVDNWEGYEIAMESLVE